MVISTSMGNSCRIPFLYHQFAQQAVGKTAGDADWSVASGFGICGWGSCEIQGFIVGSAPDVLCPGFVSTFNHYFTSCSDVSLVACGLNLALLRHEHFQAARFLFVGDGILQLQRRRIRPRRVLEGEDGV